jgi:exodeoxyribonuclease VII large subunit
VQGYQQRTDEMHGRLGRAIQGLVRYRNSRLMEIYFRLGNCNPGAHVKHVRSILEMLLLRLLKSNEKIVYQYHERIIALSAKLGMLNPKAVLRRGYSITRTLPELKVVVDSESVINGQRLEILLAKGKIRSTVDG